MNREILQTDIDLARTLVRESRPPAEIAQRLSLRGIDKDRALALVLQITNGEKVEPDTPPFLAFYGSGQASAGTPRAADPVSPALRMAPQQEIPRRDFVSTAPEWEETEPEPSRAKLFIVLGIGACILATVVAILSSQGLLSSRMLTVTARQFTRPRADVSAATSVAMGEKSQASNSAAPQLELTVDGSGLRFGETPVTSDNLMSILVKKFGAASRTNQPPNAPGTTVYTFDTAGLVVYVQSGGRCRLLVDFAGLGKEAGASQPFKGSFNCSGKTVSALTPPQELKSIPELGQADAQAVSTTGVLRARFPQTEVYFAYLKDTAHLTMVQINCD